MTKKQLTLEDSVQKVRKFKVDEDVLFGGEEVAQDSGIICGNCGTAMRAMGLTGKRKESYEGLDYKTENWQMSCRACRKSSAKVRLNPIPPMAEIDDPEYFERDDRGNIVEVVSLAGENIINSLSATEERNGFLVLPDEYDEETHKEIDEQSTDVDIKQLKIFQF